MIYPWSYSQDITTCETIEQVMEKAGLNYKVNKLPAYYKDFNGGEEFIAADNPERPGFYLTVRADNGYALGMVGNQYKVLQMEDVFSFLQNLKNDEGLLTWHNAGTFFGGVRAWIAARIEGQTFEIDGNEVECWLFANNSFDGRSKVGFSLIPTIEGNAIPVIDKAKRDCEFVHKGDLEEKSRNAAKVLHVSDVYMNNVRTKMGVWSSKTITAERFAELLFSAKDEDGDRKKENVERMREAFVAKAHEQHRKPTALDGFLVAASFANTGELGNNRKNAEVNRLIGMADGRNALIRNAQKVADKV